MNDIYYIRINDIKKKYANPVQPHKIQLKKITNCIKEIHEFTDSMYSEHQLQQNQLLNEELSIKCKQGCNHCCRTFMIAITYLEVHSIVKFIEDLTIEMKSKLIDSILNSNPTKNYGGAKSTPCSLLTENGCSVHDIKPFACKAHNSIDLKYCKDLEDIGYRKGEINRVMVGDYILNEINNQIISPMIDGGHKYGGIYVEINSTLKYIYSNGLQDEWKKTICELPKNLFVDYNFLN